MVETWYSVLREGPAHPAAPSASPMPAIAIHLFMSALLVEFAGPHPTPDSGP